MELSGRKVFTSFLWKFLEKSCVQLTTFIVTIILAKILTPKEFGTIAIIMIFINLANVIVDGGLTAALIQKKNADNIDFSTIFYSSVVLSIVLYAVLYLISPYIANFYNNNDLISVIRFLSVMIVPCAINSVQKAYVSRFLLFRKMFICSLIAIFISGIIGIIMAIRGYGIWSLTFQVVINQILTTFLMFVFIKWKPILIFSFDRFRFLFDFGWKIFLTNFIIAIYEDIRGLLIGKLYQPSTLAYFDRGKQFPSLIMGNINSSIQTVLFPVFSYAQDEKEKLKSMIKKSTQISSFFVFPLLCFLITSAIPLVKVLLNESWLPCVPFIRIFSIALILMPIQSSNMIAIKSMGYSNITLKIEIIKKIIEFIILIISFMLNVYAIAWGVAVYNFISLFINCYPISKILGYKIKQQIRDISSILIISIFANLISYLLIFLNLSPVILLLLQFIVSGAIYLTVAYIFNIEALSIAIKTVKKVIK